MRRQGAGGRGQEAGGRGQEEPTLLRVGLEHVALSAQHKSFYTNAVLYSQIKFLLILFSSCSLRSAKSTFTTVSPVFAIQADALCAKLGEVNRDVGETGGRNETHPDSPMLSLSSRLSHYYFGVKNKLPPSGV